MNDLFANIDGVTVQERVILSSSHDISPKTVAPSLQELINRYQRKELTFMELVHKARADGFDTSNLYWQVEQ